MLSKTDGPIGLRSSSSASSLSGSPIAASTSVRVVPRDSSSPSIVCALGVSSATCWFYVGALGESEIRSVLGIGARIRACSWYIIRASLVSR
ncbi:hypothetical protein ACFX16_003742 [Malus domestica]